MATEYINGVPQTFGPSVQPDNVSREAQDASPVRTIEHYFKYDALPAASANLPVVIPAYSQIVDARLETRAAFTGGTSYTIGLQTTAGVEIDNDGLFTAANLPIANINAKGKWVVGSGALVGAGVGANGGQLVAAAAGTFTGGEARLIVRYIPASVD